MRRIWPLLFAIVLLAACKREKEVIIPDNEAPPDSTVSNVVLESYVNRSYIALLGYQPDAGQMAVSTGILRTHNCSQQDRDAFLSQLVVQPAYFQRVFDIGRGTLLNGIDTSDIRDELTILNFILSDSNYLPFWPQAQLERGQLVDVMAIPQDLQAGSISIIEMHRRLVTNKGYDQINMGTQNFVISVFQNFLARYPTDAERAAGEVMVDGFPSQLFLENGRTKTDFIAIFLRSNDYYEGQVRELFRRYLFREPQTEELESYTLSYKASGNYQALQKAVLSIDEYLGL